MDGQLNSSFYNLAAIIQSDKFARCHIVSRETLCAFTPSMSFRSVCAFIWKLCAWNTTNAGNVLIVSFIRIRYGVVIFRTPARGSSGTVSVLTA